MDATTIAWPPQRAVESAELQRWRDEARTQLLAAGLPDAGDEHWRRADFGFLAALAGGLDARADADAPAFAPLDLADATHRVFVDGRHAPALDRDAGYNDDDAFSLSPLHAADAATLLPNAALSGDLRLALLNHALGADGARLVVRQGRAARAAIVLDHRGARQRPGLSAVSHAIRLEAGASATLIEHYDDRCAAPRTLLGDVQIELGAGSRLLHLRLFAPTHAAHHVDTLRVVAAADAHYAQRVLATPARALRSTQTLRLTGDGAGADLRLGAVARDRTDVDLRVLIEHAANATRSEQTMHVLGAGGRATVDSEVSVERGTRAVRTRQSLRALLLRTPCDVALRPRLAIRADEVDCRHGATTSALSDAQLFYLRSRGLPLEEARALLAAAHLRQLFTPAADAALDALVQREVDTALAAAVAAPRAAA